MGARHYVDMEALTFLSLHLIVMFAEAAAAALTLLHSIRLGIHTGTAAEPDSTVVPPLHGCDPACTENAAATTTRGGRGHSQQPPAALGTVRAVAVGAGTALSLSQLAVLWQLGYVLSEPLLLSAQIFLGTTKVAGVLAGGALALIGCAAAALTYAAALSLRRQQQPAWLKQALATAMLLAAAITMASAGGDPAVAQGIGLVFYLLGRVPLALLWIGVAWGSPCCCGDRITLTAPIKSAGAGCGLFLLSLVMAGVDPDHSQWMALGWFMLPTGASCSPPR